MTTKEEKEPDIPFKGMTIMDLWREYKEARPALCAWKIVWTSYLKPKTRR